MIIVYLVISLLFGRSMVMLFEKWGIDDLANTNRFLSHIWKTDPCLNCRSFWFALLAFNALVWFPLSVLLIGPLATWPILVKLNSSSNAK